MELYGKDASRSPDLARLVSVNHFDRLCSLLDRTKGTVEVGKVRDREQKFLDLHVVTNVKADDSLMEEELFGPILPIVVVESPEEAIEFVNAGEKPLALYLFSKCAKLQRQFVESTSSGGVTINDVAIMCGINSLPFGGVGQSGYGCYHGKSGFQNFSHSKSVLTRDLGFIGENLGKFRYAPYTDFKLRIGSALLKTRRSFLPSWLIQTFWSLGLVALGAVGAYGIMTRGH